jgi:hypothetical protein
MGRDLSPIVERTAMFLFERQWQDLQEFNEWDIARTIAQWLIEARYYQGSQSELSMRIVRLFIAHGYFNLPVPEW